MAVTNSPRASSVLLYEGDNSHTCEIQEEAVCEPKSGFLSESDVLQDSGFNSGFIGNQHWPSSDSLENHESTFTAGVSDCGKKQFSSTTEKSSGTLLLSDDYQNAAIQGRVWSRNAPHTVKQQLYNQSYVKQASNLPKGKRNPAALGMSNTPIHSKQPKHSNERTFKGEVTDGSVQKDTVMSPNNLFGRFMDKRKYGKQGDGPTIKMKEHENITGNVMLDGRRTTGVTSVEHYLHDQHVHWLDSRGKLSAITEGLVSRQPQKIDDDHVCLQILS